MSLLQVINQIDTDKFEEEVKEDFYNRKDMLKKMGSWGKKLAFSALPVGAIAAFAEPARAQSTRTVTEVLNYALTLEFLEAEFYTRAQNSGIYNNPPSDSTNIAAAHVQPTFDEIQTNEVSHVNLLKAALGENAVSKPSFNYNVAGLQPFDNFNHFLILSQAFEDTGVRAYKGQAPFLQQNNQVLTTALRVHSVEARHASAVRRIRGGYVQGDIQGWIPDTQQGFPDALQGVYLGDPAEDNVTHAGVNVANITNSIDRTAITEAWDEPLSANYVTNLVDPFITSN